VISDLHLGARTGSDVLRDERALDVLLGALEGVERLVLLGDALELRHGPTRDALDVAAPILRRIGARLGADVPVVLAPGNHDHALVAPWLERRAFDRLPRLGLEEHAGADASDATLALAEALRPARLEVFYPGVWLRDDVYATHGHYLDRHVTVPTFERLATGAMARIVGEVPEEGASAEDYEAALGPLYAWLHALARRSDSGSSVVERQTGSARAWKALTDSGPRPLRAKAMVAAFPLGIQVLNLLGLGPVKADLSVSELRRAGLEAMGETVRRMGIDAPHVLFGHTHRGGPREGEDAAEWELPGGVRLANAGCWVYEETYLRGAGPRSPYWPGRALELDADGAPRLVSLLDDWRPAD
jgi:hypothetical protein